MVLVLWDAVGDFCGDPLNGGSVFSLFWPNKLLVFSVPVLLYQILIEFGADSFRKIAALDPRVVFDARHNIWNSDWKMLAWAFLLGAAAWLLLGFAGMLQSKRRI